MKNFNLKSKLGVVALFSAILLNTTAGYAASCERHIYNNSQKPWTFVNQPTKGNLYFSNGCPTNGPCEIAAGQTVAIRYTQTNGISRGYTKLIDYKDAPVTLVYANNIWTLGHCPIIESGRETASVDVNRPANGDYTINRDAWYE